jgi:glycosyltransferase involved in cell wall biosynthesis
MRILSLTPWPIYPAMSGGQERCWNLLSRIPENTVYSLDWVGESRQERVGDTNLKVIAADDKARDQAKKLMQSGVQTFDPIPMLTKENLVTIRREIDNYDPDLVILEHPWLLDLIDDRPFVYDSHNCETVSTAQQRPHSLDLDLVQNLERRATQQAEHMTYTGEDDLKQMRKLYPFTTPVTHIPNGVDIPGQRATGEELNLMFVGSLYAPNVQAAKTLISLAPLMPEYKIRIAGSVCNLLETDYDNVELLGQVTDKQLDYYLKTSFAFVNLMGVGSGTSLKVGRALAYGLPVITTVIGGRGYTSPLVTHPAYLPDMLQALRKNWQHHSDKAYEEALTITWDNISQRFNKVIYSA